MYVYFDFNHVGYALVNNKYFILIDDALVNMKFL